MIRQQISTHVTIGIGDPVGLGLVDPVDGERVINGKLVDEPSFDAGAVPVKVAGDEADSPPK